MSKRLTMVLIALVLIVFALLICAAAGGITTYLITQANIRTASAAQQIEYDRDSGILISSVVQGSPAESAGIVRGDILVSLNGENVNNPNELHNILEELEKIDKLELTVIHGDEQKVLRTRIRNSSDYQLLGILTCESFKPEPDFSISQFIKGVMIKEVIPSSPAENAGLSAGDQILAVNGKQINFENNLDDLIEEFDPGDEVEIKIKAKDGKTSIIKVTLGKHPDDEKKAFLGIYYNPITPFPVHENPFNFDPEKFPFEEFDHRFPEFLPDGVIIMEVIEKSPADKAGLQKGDLISSINDIKIENPKQLVELIQNNEPNDKIALTISRNGEDDPITLDIVLAENPEDPDQAFLGIRISDFRHFEIHKEFYQDEDTESHIPFYKDLPFKDLFKHLNPGQEL